MSVGWSPSAVIRWLVVLLIWQTVVTVLFAYRDYFPPDFRTDFLLGRRSYFYGAYQWAFYVHIVAGPVSLLLGLVLLSSTIRRFYPAWHRGLGRVQVANILLLVAPSGLWMAWYAATGTVAASGFAMLAACTATCAALGWRCAVARRFDDHRRWMERSYALLCSAVVLRVIGGASDVMALDWTYPYAAWLSWLLPLALLEFLRPTPLAAPRHQSST